MADRLDDDDGRRYASSRKTSFSRTGSVGQYSTFSQQRALTMASTDHMAMRRYSFWLEPAVRFNLLGFPTQIAWSTLLVALVPLLYVLQGRSTLLGVAAWVVAVVSSILIHELGHALAARRYQLAPISIAVHGVGGFCLHQSTPSYRERLVVSLAGPLLGMVPGVVAYLLLVLLAPGGTLGYFLDSMVYIGILWSGLNLLPIIPLDGGNALAALLQEYDPWPGLAMPIVWGVGTVTAVVGAVLAAVFWQSIFVTVLALVFAYHNGSRLWRWRNADKPRKPRS